MAQHVLVQTFDDLDGSEADDTVQFGLGSKSYEIDLSARNAAKLRGILAPFVAHGRTTGRRVAGTRVTGASRLGRDRVSGREVRRWAAEHGHDISERGRIPGRIVEAFARRDQASAGAAEAAPTSTSKAAIDPLAYSHEVRRWAKKNGHPVGERGRLGFEVLAAYRAAQAAGGTRAGRRPARRATATVSR